MQISKSNTTVCARPVVGMTVDPKTGGYWEVATDGGIFSFGAPFFGSMGGKYLAQPIVGMEALADGQGYRFVAADGGVFDFGSARFLGSMGGKSLSSPIVGMAVTEVVAGWLGKVGVCLATSSQSWLALPGTAHLHAGLNCRFSWSMQSAKPVGDCQKKLHIPRRDFLQLQGVSR